MSKHQGLPAHPFEDQRYMGTVTRVLPASVHANLPLAGSRSGRTHHGHRMAGGEVGEFVTIECDSSALFGRILEVRLPERERLDVEEELGKSKEVHPVGIIQLLATISLTGEKPVAGISSYPRLGNRIYAAHPDLIRWIIRRIKPHSDGKEDVTLEVGVLPNVEGAPVEFTPEQLFGRHCAILGSTGGGKSWTIARIIGQALQKNGKLILLDATGEFYPLTGKYVKHVQVGAGDDHGTGAEVIDFPYRFLTEEDLFSVFTPSIQSQAPKLREAIKSLKIAKLLPSFAQDGLVVKANQPKIPYMDAYGKTAKTVDYPGADFEIRNLVQQIEMECVWPSSRSDTNRWGDTNNNELAYCVPLQLRIASIINSPGLKCVFQPSCPQTVPSIIGAFLKDPTRRVLRISMMNLPFANNAREIVVNALGRYLLDMARKDIFKAMPIVVFLDEAHQFLNKQLGNEEFRSRLDAFGLIAKEGRKYGLCVCIATQRPRDIPEDVLSQIGTLIVHRLINDRDREIVERASGEIDRSAAAFIPTLGPGEAIIVGVDFPVPFSIKVGMPRFKPESSGPDFQKHWKTEMEK